MVSTSRSGVHGHCSRTPTASSGEREPTTRAEGRQSQGLQRPPLLPLQLRLLLSHLQLLLSPATGHGLCCCLCCGNNCSNAEFQGSSPLPATRQPRRPGRGRGRGRGRSTARGPAAGQVGSPSTLSPQGRLSVGAVGRRHRLLRETTTTTTTTSGGGCTATGVTGLRLLLIGDPEGGEFPGGCVVGWVLTEAEAVRRTALGGGGGGALRDGPQSTSVACCC